LPPFAELHKVRAENCKMFDLKKQKGMNPRDKTEKAGKTAPLSFYGRCAAGSGSIVNAAWGSHAALLEKRYLPIFKWRLLYMAMKNGGLPSPEKALESPKSLQ